MQNRPSHILTFSCRDVAGIVAAVAGFLADHSCFIIESEQFGDPSTGRFFMRCEFEITNPSIASSYIFEQFSSVASSFAMEWDIHDTTRKPRVLLMVSKQGHCLNDILHRHSSGSLAIDIPAIVSNHETMKPLASWHDIPYHYLPITKASKEAQEERVLKIVEDEQIDLVVLARYMQVLSPMLVTALRGRAINIHHSFLPSFKGAKPYHQAYMRGVKLIGATAHYVSDALDEGPIIEQEVSRVSHRHTPEMLVTMGRDIESRVLARAIKFHVERRVLPNGNKTVVFA